MRTALTIHLLLVIFSSLAMVKKNEEALEPYIVNAKNADIQQYPHSVSLSINQQIDIYYTKTTSCGGSILNQGIILSAAHCIDECIGKSCRMMAKVGNSMNTLASATSVSHYLVHKQYNRFTSENDICLIGLRKPLSLGSNVQRVAIMKDPPRAVFGEVAGWGYVDEENKIGDSHLKYVAQRIWDLHSCNQYLRKIPASSFCAGDMNSDDYPSVGDSGSALIIDNYIQIGIVSCKQAHRSKSLIIYTDVRKFFDWIRRNAKKITCF